MAVKSEYAHDLHGELSARLVLDDWERAWVVVVLAEVEQADKHELRVFLQQGEQVRDCGLGRR